MKRLVWNAGLVMGVCLTLSGAASGAEGWKFLFNGENLDGWKTVGSPEWTVEDGILSVQGNGAEMGWLVADGEYSDFVLQARFQWNEGNSGIQFRSEAEDGKMIGYQANLDPSRPTATGTLLEENKRGVIQESALQAEELFKKGEWNTYEISAIGDEIRIYINGQKTVEVKDAEGAKSGLIALQMQPAENAAMKWSDIRILELPQGSEWVSLFDGETLKGWQPIGDSEWSVQDGALYGKSKGGDYGWLISEPKFLNFHYSCLFKIPSGNSGVQFRSERDGEMVNGFQADIASDSDWISGHLYDQGGLGVVVKPEQDFSKLIDWNGWNTYEITAIGPRVELFINGIKSVEYDKLPMKEGIFAFQIHSGMEMETSWKDLRVIPLPE